MSGVKDDIRKHWKVVLVIVVFPFAWYFGDKWAPIEVPKSWFLFGMLAVALFLGDSLWKSWRYSTRVLVCPTLHKSVKAPLYTVGDWLVAPLGSVDTEGFSWEGGEGTLVVPLESFEVFPEFVVSWTEPKPVDPESLPMEVQNFIKGKRACGYPYYFAFTNLKVTRPETLFNDIRERVYASDKPITREEFKKIVEEEINKEREKFRRVTTIHDDKFADQMKVITTFDTLLGQITKGGGRIFDFIGFAQRAMRKRSLVDLMAKEEKKGVSE